MVFLFRTLILGCAFFCAISCSTIKPKRITATNDTEAVGLRYYETRPFLIVRKPYPISSVPYLVQGVLANDGKSFFVTQAPEELKLPVWTELKVGQVISPAGQGGNLGRAAQAQGETAADAALQGTDDGKKEAKESNTTCAQGTQTATTKPDGETSEATNVECKDTSGQRLAFSSISLETDLTGTAIVPINELFSIIYLPDYDREFYVESQARWGMSKLHITRGPGGALLAYNSEVDNSAVVKPLFDAWNALVSAATKAAVIKIEPKAQGERVDGSKVAPLTPQGTPTTLRIHLVKFAVPGVYPFIKPDEAVKWGAATADAGKRMLVPSFPYQVPYDYFTVLIAEQLLDPAGSSALVSGVFTSVQSAGSSADSALNTQQTVNCQKDHGLPPIGYSTTNANLLLQSDPELKGSIAELKGDAGVPQACAKTLHITFTGDGSRKAGIEAKLKATFPKVELDVTPK